MMGKQHSEPYNVTSGLAGTDPAMCENHVATIFETIARLHPDRRAIVQAGHEPVSFRELERISRQFALELVTAGLGPGCRVALCAGQSIEALIAIVAIVRAGAAYVPIDPSYPDAQLSRMLADAQPELILATRNTSGRLAAARSGMARDQTPIRVLGDVLDEVQSATGCPGLADRQHEFNVRTAADPIYVMYTSGSTGGPKGVVVPHRAVVRLTVNQDYCNLSADEVILHLAPLAFDASTFEIWGALLNGGCVAVAAEANPSLDDIAHALREHAATTAWLTAGLFHLMVDAQIDALAGLHQLLAGGDVLSPDHVRRFRARFPDCRLINGYGPTENTTFSCCATLNGGHWASGSVPIGREIAGTQVFIVDDALQPVAAGSAGQLVVAGEGLAIGYLGQPEMTREKFVEAPAPIARRVYLTGDLARSLPDGAIEFLGRMDRQVKISGKRVEPGEIEEALRACGGVNDACVVIETSRARVKRIVAFVSTGAIGEMQMSAIASAAVSHARETLAEHLQPWRVMAVVSLPVTHNGKVDRDALLALLPSQDQAQTQGGSTRGYMERQVAELWRDVLGVDEIGLDDAFFDIGGKSLQLMQLHAALQNLSHTPIAITELFARTTVRAQAELLAHGPSTADAARASDFNARAARQRAALARRRLAAAG
jgi:amino acid adenylation domain-containing protein